MRFVNKTGVAIHISEWCRRNLFLALLTGGLLSGCTTPAFTDSTEQLTFDRYEFGTNARKRQTIVTGFFLGGPVADFALLHIDENNHRILQMYSFVGDAWVPKLNTRLQPGVLFVDVAKIDGRDRLITYEEGHLKWFDPDSSMEHLLLPVKIGYRPATQQEMQQTGAIQREIPRVEVTRDLNNDSRDDVVIPDFDGFWISTQLADGSFTRAEKLGPAEPFLDEVAWMDAGRTYRQAGISSLTIPLYLSRVHQADFNRDGLNDLVFWNKDHFDVHLQDARGQFFPVAETVFMEAPFDSDGIYSHLFGLSGESTFSLVTGFRAKTGRTVLYGMLDINDDGVADMITQLLEGRSFMRQRSRYEVRFGVPFPGSIMYPHDASTTIHPRGKAGLLQIAGYSSQLMADFDGDARIDIMFTDVRVGIGGILRTLTGNSVPMDIEIFRFEGEAYPARPTFRQKIRRFAPFAGPGNIFFPPVLAGDVTGDGRLDLLVGKYPRELVVYAGVKGPDLLKRQAQKVAVKLPQDERYTWLADLNRDGKQDILIYYGPTARAPDKPYRLMVLITR